jgi:glycosyltransferase involved in cell wall biosynthesis
VYSDHFHVCRYAIDEADLVITQLDSQRDLLWRRFQKRAVTIRNPVDLSARVDAPAYGERQIALWVGRADNYKKMPALLLDLARAYPSVKFVMVMNADRNEVAYAIRRDHPKNVAILDQVSYRAIEALYAQAFVFVSTSLTEGFPNTFLQAGKYGVPILSLAVDPDGFIERYNCGVVAHGDVEALLAGLKTIMWDQTHGAVMSANIFQYVSRYHDLNERVVELQSVLKSVVTEASSVHDEGQAGPASVVSTVGGLSV